MTPNQRRSVRRRRVGWMDAGGGRRKAFPVHKGDTEEMAQAVFTAYDPDLVLGAQMLVDWCPHTADYQYRHDCADWCERPVPRMVWTATYSGGAAQEQGETG